MMGDERSIQSAISFDGGHFTRIANSAILHLRKAPPREVRVYLTLNMMASPGTAVDLLVPELAHEIGLHKAHVIDAIRGLPDAYLRRSHVPQG